jgi:hypothetical protein
MVFLFVCLFKLASNHNPPISASQVAGNADVTHSIPYRQSLLSLSSVEIFE